MQLVLSPFPPPPSSSRAPGTLPIQHGTLPDGWTTGHITTMGKSKCKRLF